MEDRSSLAIALGPPRRPGNQERRIDAFLCGLSQTECINDEGPLSLAPDRRFVTVAGKSTVVFHHGHRKQILAGGNVAGS